MPVKKKIVHCIAKCWKRHQDAFGAISMEWTEYLSKIRTYNKWVFETTWSEESTCAFGSYDIVAQPCSLSLNSRSSSENLTKASPVTWTRKCMLGDKQSTAVPTLSVHVNMIKISGLPWSWLVALYSITFQLIMRLVTWVFICHALPLCFLPHQGMSWNLWSLITRSHPRTGPQQGISRIL